MSIHTRDMSGNPSTDAVLEQAESWFARLNAADCSAEERMAFQRWRAEPAHAAAFAATEEMWRMLGGLAEREDFQALTQKILADTSGETVSNVPRRHRSWVYGGVAAALCCAAVAGVVVYSLRAAPSVYLTEPGERSTVTLADGSRIFLNSDTALEVRLDNKRRHFQLRRGEVLFDVASDPQRPFTVAAGDGEVTALGTRFMVRDERQKVTVTLLEGAVALNRAKTNQHLRLRPGQQVWFTPGRAALDQRTVDPGVASSWSTGRLRFRYTPLEEALSEVNRYSPVRIRIGDPALAQIRISGTFEIGDGRSVVSALEGLFAIEADATPQGEIVLRSR